VRLLERTTRSVKLTAAGQQFLEQARHTLAQVEQAVESAQRHAEGRCSQLRVGYVPRAALDVLPRALREFRRRHAAVDIALSTMVSARQVPALMEGRLHFGFLRPSVHAAGLSTQILYRERVVAALPRSHPLADKATLELADLAQEGFIHFSAAA